MIGVGDGAFPFVLPSIDWAASSDSRHPKPVHAVIIAIRVLPPPRRRNSMSSSVTSSKHSERARPLQQIASTLHRTIGREVDVGDSTGAIQQAIAAERDSKDSYRTGHLRWLCCRNSDQLNVEIDTAMTIALSLHDADGVRIRYHVPKRLMMPLMSESFERRTEQFRANGMLKDGDDAELTKMDQGWRRWEEDFIHWVSGNAVVDED
jgi:hypothetical protein